MSIEGIRRSVNQTEQESGQETPAAIEELLSSFDELHETTVSKDLPHKEREEVYSTLHGIAEHFENQAMFTAYEEGRIPTFQSMERAVALADAQLTESEDDSDSIRLRKLLSQRVKEIRRWCSKYEQSIVVFHRKRKQAFRIEGHDVVKEFEKADEDRRRIHNSLMESMQSLDTVITEIDDYEPLREKIYRFDTTQEVPDNFAATMPFIFSARAASHENRDFIRDWALVANLEQKLDAQRAYLLAEEIDE